MGIKKVFIKLDETVGKSSFLVKLDRFFGMMTGNPAPTVNEQKTAPPLPTATACLPVVVQPGAVNDD